MKKAAKITNINALYELERLAWEYEPGGEDDEMKIKCPVHDDDKPSAFLNVKRNLWRCYTCKAKGDVVTLLSHIAGVTRQVMVIDLSKRYDLAHEKIIQPDIVEKYHAKIWEAGPLLSALRDRGITDSMIREARIGYKNGRLTIPIWSSSGAVVNIRSYLPGAPMEEKLKNAKGFGKLQLYRRDKIPGVDNIWVCGGELKALVVGELLKNKGIDACAATAGEGSWDTDWNNDFKGKRVFVCMDVDSAGKQASEKIASILYGVASEVRIVRLPLDKEQYPKGDVNDLVGQEGADAGTLLRIMDQAVVYEPGEIVAQIEKGVREVNLGRVTDPSNIGYRVTFDAIVSAIDPNPFLVPNEVKTACSRDEPLCHLCPIKRLEADDAGFTTCSVQPTHEAILEMVGSGKSAQEVSLKQALNIPKCRSVTFTTSTWHRVWDVRLSPQLAITGDSAGSETQPAICVACDPELNIPYALQGRVYPHPRNQQATLVLDVIDQTEDSLASFKPTSNELDALNIFRPKNWTLDGLQEKLDDLYSDLESNVTQIFDRRDLHLAMDLSWHSPLFFKFSKKRVNGWTSVLIIGDSSQGKSETFATLKEHYRLGEKVECRNATVAGLLGGLQQLGTKWFVSWGIIPTHDRRLVCLEEVKGANTDTLGSLTDMRSTGVAEIPKIERKRTHARTRLIFISNPRRSRPISSYSFGVEAIHELMGGLEDVRRFDLAVVVAAGEVSSEAMDTDVDVTHRHSSDLCRRLILWGWTLEEQQVVIDDDTVQSVRTHAAELCKNFSETLPLVDRGTIRHKLCKLGSALAVRTFSEENGSLIVRPCHIEYVAQLLARSYSAPACGYDRFSRAQKDLNTIRDPEGIKTFILNMTKFPEDLIRGLQYRDEIAMQDVQDWCELDREAAGAVISFLVRKHALKRSTKTTYTKTPEFIGLLKEMAIEAPTSLAKRIEEEL